tara:strand:+ start:7259 stop:7813 length:555 start_codon:yes stop_codon:yes gene_type:complete
MNFEKGYLKVILGPMFSGKTTELVRIYNKYMGCDIPCSVINHSNDKRYDSSKMSTHSQIMIDSINTDSLLSAINPILQTTQVFIINEGQFFSDLYEAVLILLKSNKTVYVCGLDGDFKRDKFGDILDIIPLSDDIVKLKGICTICKKNESIFTHRTVKNESQVLIGEKDMYMSLCRKCYNHVNL